MLLAVAGVGVVLLVIGLWFAAALLFRLRFQLSVRSLLVLVVAVALPFSWLAAERKNAREQKAAVEEIERLGGRARYDIYEINANAVPPKLLGTDFFKRSRSSI